MDFKEEAERLLKEKNYDELLKISEEEILNNPNSVEGYRYKSYCIEGDDELKCLDKILELNPKDFEAHKDKALNIFYKNKNTKEIIDYLDSVIEKYPEEARAYIAKASALDIIKSSLSYTDDNIEEACLKAIELDPNHIEPYDILGDIYYDKDCYEEAKEYYEEALRLDNNDYSANFGMVRCISETEGIEKAIEYCNELIEKDSNNIDFYTIKFILIAFYVDFEATEETKEMLKNEIIESFNKLIKENPDESNYYDDLGSFYVSLEDYESAIDIYNEALNKFPDEKEDFEKEIEHTKGLMKVTTEGITNNAFFFKRDMTNILIFLIIVISALIINFLTGDLQKTISAIRKLLGF